MKRVLITGSSGLVGSETVSFFDQRGWEVHGVDNNMRRSFFGADGDTTWTKLPLPVDLNTGVIEVQMHPADPETLLVATWERRRDGFDSHAGALAAGRRPGSAVDPPLEAGYDAYDPIKKWGKGGGIYKTTDGGKSFRKLTKGLPTNQVGRVGLDYYRPSQPPWSRDPWSTCRWPSRPESDRSAAR